ncbi:hypothetical protein Hanom_Chr07g00676041 [Helianthus anomalus]
MTLTLAAGIGSASVRDHDPKYLQLWQYTFPSTTTVAVLSCLVGVSWAVAAANRQRMVMMMVHCLLAIFVECCLTQKVPSIEVVCGVKIIEKCNIIYSFLRLMKSKIYKGGFWIDIILFYYYIII